MHQQDQQQQQRSYADVDPANTFKFLITTDNHLGYLDKDPIRKEDSFIAFEECLDFGRNKHDADAVLLSGDFFHENKPTLPTLTHSMALFRKYCYGDKDIEFEVLSDATSAFNNEKIPERYSLAGVSNFQDPNINVAMPVFMIHGNHDDPMNGYSSIDLLQAAGLVNYFGRVEDCERIELTPILMRKGNTYVALYGMGNVRDERLHRCLKYNKVTFKRPRNNINGREIQWFSILLLHQNRGYRFRGSTNGMEEKDLKNSGIDLVIWGNEHEQLIQPVSIETSSGRRARYNNNNDDDGNCNNSIDVIQPGSTIHTSMPQAVGGTPAPKACGILEINSCIPEFNGSPHYQVLQHNLQCVRPLLTKSVILNEVVFDPRNPNVEIERPERFTSDAEVENFRHRLATARHLPKTKEDVEKYLRKVANQMIEDAENQYNQQFDENDPEDMEKKNRLGESFGLPLIRIAVDFAGNDENDAPYPEVQLLRIGNDFSSQVANPSDMFKKISTTEKAHLARRRAALRAEVKNNNNGDDAALLNDNNLNIPPLRQQLHIGDIRTKIANFLNTNTKNQCAVLPEMKIAEAVYTFAEKGEKDAIDRLITSCIEDSVKSAYDQHKGRAVGEIQDLRNNNNNNEERRPNQRILEITRQLGLNEQDIRIESVKEYCANFKRNSNVERKLQNRGVRVVPVGQDDGNNNNDNDDEDDEEQDDKRNVMMMMDNNNNNNDNNKRGNNNRLNADMTSGIVKQEPTGDLLQSVFNKIKGEVDQETAMAAKEIAKHHPKTRRGRTDDDDGDDGDDNIVDVDADDDEANRGSSASLMMQQPKTTAAQKKKTTATTATTTQQKKPRGKAAAAASSSTQQTTNNKRGGASGVSGGGIDTTTNPISSWK